MSPLYGWQPGGMRELDLARTKTPEVSEPTSVDAAGGSGKAKLFKCGVDECGAKFKKAMILARHFNTNHEVLKVDKDSWRQYLQEIWE